ncbi:MAG: glutamine synthetase family protein [Bacteroidales bacterium]|jgi:glutamine synthetase|nr:glutamine synthetase family protein [Bacteroidales bacterium]
MDKEQLATSLNPLVQQLNKEAKDFTKSDIIQFIVENEIKMLNFRYVGGDGRLKTLNFVISDIGYLEQILSYGERVDGSSLFSFVEAGSSDLYVIPRFKSAFMDPFAEIPTLCLLCSYYTGEGNPLEIAPEYILKKAAQSFRDVTGMEFQAMGELEYYVIGDKDDLFVATDQKGYHESAPFAKFENFRMEAIHLIARCGGMVKYGHSEVGNFTMDNKIYEQNEIEFLVTDVEEAANQLIIAKWIIRKLAHEYGLDVTFAPKITTGKAGSGMHIHTRIVKDGENCMVTDGKLNDTAKTAIAGYMQCAPSLTAFGNANPTSYFRLVPHQEAPTTICWGDRNRSVLVRVPLGWTTKIDMVANENPLETPAELNGSQKQTVEFRCPDGSADVYLLLAGLTVAARSGFELKRALEFAKRTYVDVNIFHEEQDKDGVIPLDSLPASCWDSAEALNKQRAIYERHGVFPPQMIDGVIMHLKMFKDKFIRKELETDPDKMMELVHQYFYCG